MSLSILGVPPSEVHFSIIGPFIQAKMTGQTVYSPLISIYMSECAKFGMNWLVVWCMNAVITGNFRHPACGWPKDNPFLLKNEALNDFEEFPMARDGVRAGVQVLAIQMGLGNRIEEGDFVWRHALNYRRSFSGPKITDVQSLDAHYGAGFGEKVKALYEEVIAYANGHKPHEEPVADKPLPPQKTPEPVPAPHKETPKEVPPPPAKEKPSWKVSLAKWLGIAGTLFFVAKFFLPGAVVEIMKLVLELLKKLVET